MNKKRKQICTGHIEKEYKLTRIQNITKNKLTIMMNKMKINKTMNKKENTNEQKSTN